MHILLATDGSEQAIAAARFVRDLVNPQALARVTVLAVVRPVTNSAFFGEAAFSGIAQDVWDDLDDAAQSSASKAIQATVDALAGFAPEADTLIRTGSPADEIVHAAQEVGADLIVIGSRGWGEVRSVLLGSVSERVLHLAHRPVLIVRPAVHH